MARWHEVVARLRRWGASSSKGASTARADRRSVSGRLQLVRVDAQRQQPRHVHVLRDTCSGGSYPPVQGR